MAGVRAAVSEGGYEVVLPSSDAEVVTISSHRDQIDAVVPYPPHEVVMRALDKLDLHRAARSVGLESPSTTEPTEHDPDDLHSPVFVKARLHSPEDRDPGPARLDARRADDPSDVSEMAAEIRSSGGTPVLQEVIAGQLLAVAVVVDRDGQMVSAVQQVATRLSSQPGISVRAQTVALDPSLEKGIAALLTELGWFGLAELQFVNPSRPTLIDFNGRLYGSMALAVAAGANLPAIWAAVATGRAPDLGGPVSAPGTRYHWLDGDLRRAVHERQGGLARDLAGSLRYSLGAAHSIWRLEDPAPAIVALLDASRGLTRLWSRASRDPTH